MTEDEIKAGWQYVPADGVYLNPRLTADLTVAATSLRQALAPVAVWP